MKTTKLHTYKTVLILALFKWCFIFGAFRYDISIVTALFLFLAIIVHSSIRVIWNGYAKDDLRDRLALESVNGNRKKIRFYRVIERVFN